MWQKLGYFAGGLIVGGVAGYFTAKKLFEDRAAEAANRKAQAQIDEVRAYCDAQVKAAELNALKALTADQQVQTEQEKVLSEAPVNYAQEAAEAAQAKYTGDGEDDWGDAKRPKGAPKRRFKHDKDNVPPPYYEENGGAAIYPTEPEAEPHYISEESFTNDHFEYEKQTLFWFVGDNVVTDEEYQPLEDDSVLGKSWANHFGEEEDPDVVHVRNPKIAVDYEIIRDHRSYATTIPD